MIGTDGSESTGDSSIPLFVDLDGTLIRSDLSFEAFIAYLKVNPLFIFRVLFWLLRGRSYAKHMIAARVSLDIKNQPLVPEMVEFLKGEKARGRRLILASASERKFVEEMARHVPLFDGVIAGDGGPNISGKGKLNAIRKEIGDQPFAYAGNSPVDIAVWKEAAEVYVVSPSKGFIKSIERIFKPKKVFLDKVPPYTVLKALRPHQWSKNLLLLLPLCLAHQVLNAVLVIEVLLAVAAFCMCASAVYLMNDLCDLASDRSHPKKKRRPLAAGDMSVRMAVMLVLLLLAGAVGISSGLPLQFGLSLLIYFVITTLYSIKLKEIPAVDIVVLALLYTIRIVAGGKVTDITVSQWLMSFSLFLFLSLACLKRYTELLALSEKQEGPKGRGYVVGDREVISQLGAASGYLSLLVLVLYVNSKEVAVLYRHSQYLWLLSPLFLYWITRVWLLAHRGQVNEDPVVFALTDLVSYLVVAGMAAIILIAL